MSARVNIGSGSASEAPASRGGGGDTMTKADKIKLFSAIGILLLGCGRYSLWQGDDHWVNRQDGA